MSSKSPKESTSKRTGGSIQRKFLREGWRFRSFAAGSHSAPDSFRLDQGEWHSAAIPCTVASALRDVESIESQAFENLDEADHWFHCGFEAEEFVGGATELAFEGLATISEIWLNGMRIGTTQNMFVRSVFDVTDQVDSRNDLWICFRALGPTMKKSRSRARWRTRLVSERNLRFIRTTLLGRMPSWFPAVAPVGPWREVELISRKSEEIHAERVVLRGTYDVAAKAGRLEASIDLILEGHASKGTTVWLEVGGTRARLTCSSGEDNVLRATGTLHLEDVEPWWPHTHGTPWRYPVILDVEIDGLSTKFELERIGFRQIELVGPPGPGFGLEVNGEAIFCRGSCWTPIDPLALSCSRESMRSALEQVSDAGMNMLRVSGTMIYESDDFYEICDDLGILVWQDFMFATLDYPTDEAFLSSVRNEVEQFLGRVAPRACLGMLCGNSEGQQQPAMLGLGNESWASPIFDDLLPALCDERRPDVPYWSSTPSGGDLPFRVNHGTSHYFGVGAYRRPVTDALLARPRFMTECLALSNVPGESGADPTLPSRIPRDVGADWDFKDVTDHYLAEFYGEEAAAKSRKDPELAAALSRATSARLMEEVGTRWRDPESGCHGALVWLHRDPWSCAGWGVVDAEGRPKSAFFGLKRAWSPVALAVLDDGLNGLRLLAFNDREVRVEGKLEIQLLRFDGTVIAENEGQSPIAIDAHSSYAVVIDDLLGEFVDSSYAYRFGPRAFDLCLARLSFPAANSSAENTAIETLYLPVESGLLAREAIGLVASWRERGAEVATLSVSTERFAQTVVLEFENGIASDNFFHLPPGGHREITIEIGEADRPLRGSISALNATEILEVSTDQDARS